MHWFFWAQYWFEAQQIEPQEVHPEPGGTMQSFGAWVVAAGKYVLPVLVKVCVCVQVVVKSAKPPPAAAVQPARPFEVKHLSPEPQQYWLSIPHGFAQSRTSR